MPRPPRTFVVGYPHHVVQRGHNRRPVFEAPEDYRFYLRNLAEQTQALGLRVFAFCLMTNHVHLVLQPERDSEHISRVMRVLSGRQTRRVNKLKGRTGSLWEGRFKCSIIDTDNYLLACCRYVDLNPVRAAMVADPADYPWSSYRVRAGLCSGQPRFDLGKTIMEAGADPVAYREFVRDGIPDEEYKLIHAAVRRNQLTGDDRFAKALKVRVGRRIVSRGRGRPRKE